MTSAWPIESPEIAGVPTELLEQFSKRTAEVDRALATKLAEFYTREGRDPSRFERAALGREAAGDTGSQELHRSPGSEDTVADRTRKRRSHPKTLTASIDEAGLSPQPDRTPSTPHPHRAIFMRLFRGE